MQDKIKKLINDIRDEKRRIQNELWEEYDKLRLKYEKKIDKISKEYEELKEKYEFKLEWKKIIWNKDRIKELKKLKKSILDTLFWATVREILSFPFIWMMLIPAFILDLFLFLYQQTAIRLYKIPLVKRSDYIVFDRGQLAYLNWIQKINCIYCSYFNGLMQFAVEVAWRTERYWCPIKHASKKGWSHDWECDFADYWDPEWFKEVFRDDKIEKYIKK